MTVCCQDSFDRAVQLGADPQRIVTIFHAVDPSRFRHGPDEAQALRHALGLAAHRVVTCVAGMDSTLKGHAVLLEAVARVRRDVPDVALVLVGDGPLRPELERQSRELHLEDCCRFVGRVHSSQIEHYMKMAVCTVLPSYSEAFANVVFESLLAGVPVISSAVAAPKDVLPRGPFGWLFPAGNVAELAERVHTALRDTQHGLEMARSGAAFVRENMSLDGRIENYLQLYRQLLGRTSTRTQPR